MAFDDTTKQKAGTHIEGLDRYRDGAGSARREYCTLRGLNCVLWRDAYSPQTLAWPPPQRAGWFSHSISNLQQGQKLNVPYRSRSQLARDSPRFYRRADTYTPNPHPGRRWLCHEGLCPSIPRSGPSGSGRFPISAKLYELPPKPTHKRRGAPRNNGDLIGSPKTLAADLCGLVASPQQKRAPRYKPGCGLWRSVFPGQLIRVVVVQA